MRFMNSYDIERAVARYARHPVKGLAAIILYRLQYLADSRSDGWHSWKAPCQAARKLIELIEDIADPAAGDLKKALVPIKSFLTRHAAALQGQTISFEVDALPAPRVVDMHGWQPIATAPKDRRVLLLTPRYASQQVWIGRWNEDRYSKKPRPYWDIESWRPTISRGGQPTHWQPLPDPLETAG